MPAPTTTEHAECGVCHEILPVAERCFDGEGGYALCATHSQDVNA